MHEGLLPRAAQRIHDTQCAIQMAQTLRMRKSDKMPGAKLPDSTDEVLASLFVGAIAMLSAIARILYGKGDITWRISIGSCFMALVVSQLIFAVAIQTLGHLGGQACVAIAVISGLFLDDLMRRIHLYITKKRLPGEPDDPTADPPQPAAQDRRNP